MKQKTVFLGINNSANFKGDKIKTSNLIKRVSEFDLEGHKPCFKCVLGGES